jgi:hypothetical protein
MKTNCFQATMTFSEKKLIDLSSWPFGQNVAGLRVFFVDFCSVFSGFFESFCGFCESLRGFFCGILSFFLWCHRAETSGSFFWHLVEFSSHLSGF